jgi:hypothetical protein
VYFNVLSILIMKSVFNHFDCQLRSPMGPPTKLPVSSHKSMLGKRFHMAMEESDMKAKLVCEVDI